MKKRDVILIGCLLVIGVIGMLAVHSIGGNEGSAVRVSVNGEEYGVYSLNEDREVAVDTKYGHNLIVIKDGEAYMQEADCPDGYCMEQGRIRTGNKSIICLPHKLVVEVVGEAGDSEDDAQPDSVSQ